MTQDTDKLEAFARLLNVLSTLRTYCPWDAKQTTQSLRANTIEEVYELSDAILKEDVPDQCKELGDVLLHILFYARIAEEKGQFDLAEVCNRLCRKLIYRHPHVYGTATVSDANEVVNNWERLKQTEKEGNKTVLSGVPNSLPSVIKAFRIQEKAAAVGFDWESPAQVWEKVKEEVNEVEAEILNGCAPERMQEEFGDLLLSIINAARLYKVNPDDALEQSNRKFMRRFAYIEEAAKRQGGKVSDYPLDQLDAWWNQAKQAEHNRR